MRRGTFQSWCGYIGIPASHPWFGKDYSDPVIAPEGALERIVDVDQIGTINLLCASFSSIPAENVYEIVLLVRCHGGLTWARDHHALDGKRDGRWWFGFDCSHTGDYSPGLKQAPFEGDVYRDVAYVKAACEMACADLAAVDGATSRPRAGSPVTGSELPSRQAGESGE